MTRRRIDSRPAIYYITKQKIKNQTVETFDLTSSQYDEVWPMIREILEDYMIISGEEWFEIADQIREMLGQEGY